MVALSTESREGGDPAAACTLHTLRACVRMTFCILWIETEIVLGPRVSRALN